MLLVAADFVAVVMASTTAAATSVQSTGAVTIIGEDICELRSNMKTRRHVSKRFQPAWFRSGKAISTEFGTRGIVLVEPSDIEEIATKGTTREDLSSKIDASNLFVVATKAVAKSARSASAETVFTFKPANKPEKRALCIFYHWHHYFDYFQKFLNDLDFGSVYRLYAISKGAQGSPVTKHLEKRVYFTKGKSALDSASEADIRTALERAYDALLESPDEVKRVAAMPLTEAKAELVRLRPTLQASYHSGYWDPTVIYHEAGHVLHHQLRDKIQKSINKYSPPQVSYDTAVQEAISDSLACLVHHAPRASGKCVYSGYYQQHAGRGGRSAAFGSDDHSIPNTHHFGYLTQHKCQDDELETNFLCEEHNVGEIIASTVWHVFTKLDLPVRNTDVVAAAVALYLTRINNCHTRKDRDVMGILIFRDCLYQALGPDNAPFETAEHVFALHGMGAGAVEGHREYSTGAFVASGEVGLQARREELYFRCNTC